MVKRGKEFSFSLITDVSKKIDDPYGSETESRFLFEKDNIYLEISVGERGVGFVGWIGGVSLVLESDKLSDFCADLRRTSRVPSKVEISIPATVKQTFAVFPRIRLSIGKNLPQASIVLEDILKTLTDFKKTVEKYQTYDKSTSLLKPLWEKAKTAKTKREKGKTFEQLLDTMISFDENFNVVEKNVRTKSEEIDLVLENLGKTVFFSQLRSPLILLECKNWGSKVRAKEVRDFAQKIQNRPRVLCSIGVFVASSGLTKDANEELLGYRGKEFLIVVLNGKDIETMVKHRVLFGELLKNRISEAGLR